ncbi:MAG TPA: hypothetical protein VFD37_06850 [Solirubrobacterales bacterium]|nr:hypothetical protein [Solirubrobacterales bacterium]
MIEIGPGPVGVPVGTVKNERVEVVRRRHTSLPTGGATPAAPDMAGGRTRIPIERGQEGIHSISAAAIDEVEIKAGVERPVRIEIAMNNSAGIFQVDDLLSTKIRDTPLEREIEVVASIEGESEKRLLTGFEYS